MQSKVWVCNSSDKQKIILWQYLLTVVWNELYKIIKPNISKDYIIKVTKKILGKEKLFSFTIHEFVKKDQKGIWYQMNSIWPI